MEKLTDIKDVESQLWEELLEKFDDDERHKKYLRHCLEKNLIGRAIKRYAEYASDKEKYPVELRRIARTKSEQLTSVLMIGTRVKGEAEGKGKLSIIDILVLVLNLLLLFGALLFESGGIFILFLIAFGGYIVYKYLQISKRIRRGG